MTTTLKILLTLIYYESNRIKGLKGKAHEAFCEDVEVGKITYPLLVALHNHPSDEIIDRFGRPLSLDEKNSITAFVIKHGGVSATIELLAHYAKMSLQALKTSQIKEKTLYELCELWKYSDIPFKRFEETML